MNKNDFDVKRYISAMDGLQASHDTRTRIFTMASKKQSNFRKRWRTVAVTTVLMVFCLTGIAYAAGIIEQIQAVLTPSSESDTESFADAVFGDSSISTEHEMIVSASGELIATPNQQRTAADSDLINQTIGGYVSDVDAQVTLGNYTFTFEQFLIDENGIAVLYYTISNPDCINGWYEAGYGEISFDWNDPDGEGLANPYFTAGDDLQVDSCLLLSNVSTDTELHLVTYIGVFGDYSSGDSIQMILRVASEDEDGNRSLTLGQQTIVTFVPEYYVPARTLTDETGCTADVSDVGIAIHYPEDYNLIDSDGSTISPVIAGCVIQYNDGTEYVVSSDDTDNTVLGYSTDDSFRYAFNRLADTEEISSVIVTGTRYSEDDEGNVIQTEFELTFK